MFEIEILPKAKEDIRLAATYYQSIRNGLGLKLLSEIREKSKILSQYPYSSPIRYDSVRCSPLNKFPWMIHYIIAEDRALITFIALFHHAQHPKMWKSRHSN